MLYTERIRIEQKKKFCDLENKIKIVYVTIARLSVNWFVDFRFSWTVILKHVPVGYCSNWVTRTILWYVYIYTSTRMYVHIYIYNPILHTLTYMYIFLPTHQDLSRVTRGLLQRSQAFSNFQLALTDFPLHYSLFHPSAQSNPLRYGACPTSLSLSLTVVHYIHVRKASREDLNVPVSHREAIHPRYEIPSRVCVQQHYSASS